MFQFGQLVPELPIVENVALPLLLAGTRRRSAVAEARKWLPRLGLEQIADRLPGEVSGGQSQRAAIARALIAEPRIIFADEPTGSLDSVAADEVMELLVKCARSTAPVSSWSRTSRGSPPSPTASVGETYYDSEIAQDPKSLGGKILRLTPEGKPAPGNPFPDSLVWATTSNFDQAQLYGPVPQPPDGDKILRITL